MGKYFILLTLFFVKPAFAQLNDNFADGNLTASPEWRGDVAAFTVNIAKQLQTVQNAAAQTFSLSSANSLANNVRWEFFVQLNFDPSTNNQVRIYLTSDNENLKGSLNGYFIQIGETGSTDSYDLYRQNGTSITKIIDGSAKTRANTNVLLARIQVTRSAANVWDLKTDITGGTNFASEGTVTDNTFLSTSWFGVHCKYTTTNSDKFFFDDFKVETLVADMQAPSLLSVNVIDSLILEAVFDEPLDTMSAKVPANYSLDKGYNSPLTVKTTANPLKYQLTFAKGFITGSYTLSVKNVRDLASNIISTNKTAAFSYVKPYIAQKNDLVINEIFADPAPQIDLPSVEFIELFNTTDHTISLKNWSYSDASTSVSLPADSIKSGQYLILSAKADTSEFKIFGKVLGISPWPSLNNSSDKIKLSSPEGKVIDSVSYSDTWHRLASKKQGGWSLERIDPKCSCTGESNWNSSVDTTGGTPGRKNSIYQANYQAVSLIADSLKQLSDSTIKVFFNRPIDRPSLSAGKFVTEPAVKGTVAVNLNDGLNQVILSYSSKFAPATLYKLSVSGITDPLGNLIETANLPMSFLTPAILPQKPPETDVPVVREDTAKILITEIFADPSPEVGLPLVEFVEIYNPGKDPVDLEGWMFSDPGTKATIRKASILSKEYVILCPLADTAQYKPFGKTIGISPWPSLNNTSDHIVLKSFKNRSVDSISYADTWYKDSSKKLGGWTLERIDALSVCQGLFNWTASTDKIGGTPGRKNSVYQENYDQILLTADSLKQLSDSTLLIFFNKHIDGSAAQPDKFNISPTNGKIVSATFDIDYKQAILTYSSKFNSAKKYQLNISEIKDCSGNNISETSRILSFETPALPITPLPATVRTDTARLYITEIFADPSPEVGLPLVEFVEIYNPGKETVDLSGWMLNDPGTKATIKKTNIAPDEYVILCPAADTLLYKPFGKTVGVSPWPSLNNSSDQIVLKSFKNRLVDSVSYSDTWYKNTVKKSGGWTLEKADLLSNQNNFYSWSASENTAGGTPGKANSILTGRNNKSLVIDSVKMTSDSTFQVYLNETPDTAFVKGSYFKLSPEIPISKASFSSSFREINIVLQGHLKEDKKYLLTADSIRNYTGQIIDALANQKSIFIPGVPEKNYSVIINEIFADPSPQIGLPDTEFIELYNTSDDPVSLKGMIYEDESGSRFTFKKGEIEAKGYLIVCAEKDTSAYKSFGKTLGISTWPNLNNDRDILTLKNNKGKEINRVTYNSSWYKNKDKATGGWSLELIDPQTICSGSQNWIASTDPSGGTPGKQNSVYRMFATNDPLKMISAVLIDSVTVELSFNRPVDSLSASDQLRFSLNNGLGNPTSVMPVGPDFEKVRLTFSSPIARGKKYKVSASELTDCSGTIISSTSNSAEFFYPEKIVKNSIIINEVLFNPRSGGADFVEIYNRTDNALDLKDLHLATINEKDSVVSKKQLSLMQFLIQPHQYVVLTTDPDNIKKEYSVIQSATIIKLASLPSFNDDAGTVVLVSGDTRIDQFSYSEKMHFQLIKNPEGVSLERSSFVHPANEAGNFRSAAASAGYATPGAKNSQYVEDVPTGKEEVEFLSKTFSPDNDGFEDLLVLNYHFDKPGFIANVSVYDNRGVLIRKIAKNQTLAAEGVLIWDGLTETSVRPPVGIYMIYMEVFNLDGTVKKYRKNCVLATKLN